MILLLNFDYHIYIFSPNIFVKLGFYNNFNKYIINIYKYMEFIELISTIYSGIL